MGHPPGEGEVCLGTEVMFLEHIVRVLPGLEDLGCKIRHHGCCKGHRSPGGRDEV